VITKNFLKVVWYDVTNNIRYIITGFIGLKFLWNEFVKKQRVWMWPCVNFTNILHKAFTFEDPKIAKRLILTVFLRFWRSLLLKAARKMLVKLTRGKVLHWQNGLQIDRRILLLMQKCYLKILNFHNKINSNYFLFTICLFEEETKHKKTEKQQLCPLEIIQYSYEDFFLLKHIFLLSWWHWVTSLEKYLFYWKSYKTTKKFTITEKITFLFTIFEIRKILTYQGKIIKKSDSSSIW